MSMTSLDRKKFHKKTQEKRLSKAISLAGARYTPKLNVNVSIASVFDGIGRTTKFYDELKSPANEIVKNIRRINDTEVNKVAENEYKEAEAYSLDIASFILKIPNSGVGKIDFKKIRKDSSKARKAIYKCTQKLRDFEESERLKKQAEKKSSEDDKFTYSNDEIYRNDKSYLYKVGGILSSLEEFSRSDTAESANNPHLLLNGIAGSGKTHFLCDLAKHRVEQGLPTLIFLGEEFDTKKPLSSIKGLLDISVTDSKFLESLNQYAEAKRTRAIIIIDALNESLVQGIQWEQLLKIKRYKNLALIISIRSGFEQSVIPSSVLKSYVRVEHEGFASHEWEALTKFFAEYNLPLLEIPILFPEFRIPLFLKIFCEASSKSPEPIKGHFGFTHIFEKYVIAQGKEVLEKLGASGESVRRIWNGTIKELALYMGENGTDRVPEKKAISIAAKQFPSQGKKVLGLLEKYWLITKVPRYKKYKIVGFDYRFPYQKFSDHLIVRNLLTKNLDTTSPEDSFKPGTKLGGIIKGDWTNRGLIEALSIQVPERLRGRELVNVTPKKFRRLQVAKDSFLESLIWRDLSLKNGKPKYIKQKWVLSYLNNYILPYHGGNDSILETLITVSAIPNHPLNALLLHRHLSKKKMPERDAFWQPFLNTHYGDEGAINRLIAWGWNGTDKSKIGDESLRLASITLIWFLASSNRFLRDRTTKVLVTILSGRIPVLIQLLDDFKDIDDLYIQERLYAVSYGCVLQQTNSKKDISEIAKFVYSNVFKNGKPPTHILLRDYARGVIEFAITQDSILEKAIDVRKIRPPYGSTFPSKIPSLAYLKRKYPARRSDKEDSYGAIWYSLMYNNEGGIADFGNYVVNSTLSRWCNLKLTTSGTRKQTVKEMDTEFNKSLSRKEKRQWKKLENMRHNVHWQKTLLNFPIRDGIGDVDIPKPKLTKIELLKAEKWVQGLEKDFIKSLTSKQRGLYRKGVVPYRDNARGSDDLNSAEIQRIIFKRVTELGWTPELFGKFDSRVNDFNRDSHKSERIGKKYQWIAFHETLGIIADNFVFRGTWRDDFTDYRGAWQIWKRDIDPTFLLSKTPDRESRKKPWWINANYNSWRPSVTHTDWTKIKDDLPNQKRLIEVKARGGWLLLDGYIRWEQPPVPGENRSEYNKIRRDVWYILRSYIVKRGDAKKMFTWAKKQDFIGRWMPDPLELREIYFKEIPNSLAYQTEYDELKRKRWIKVQDSMRKNTDYNVLRTTEEYNWEGSGYDCSVEGGVNIHIPAKELLNGMRLTSDLTTGRFLNKKGEIVAQDPSVTEPGSGVLLIKKTELQEFLRKNDYEIIWAIMGEKLLLGTMGGGDGFLGRLEMGGAFRMKSDGKVEGKTYTKILKPEKRRRVKKSKKN